MSSKKVEYLQCPKCNSLIEHEYIFEHIIKEEIIINKDDIS